MGRTGRQEGKYEVYKVTAMRMLLYSYTNWTKKYGQILEIRLLRPKKISKILDRREFCQLHAISRRIQIVKQNNICSVFLKNF